MYVCTKTRPCICDNFEVSSPENSNPLRQCACITTAPTVCIYIHSVHFYFFCVFVTVTMPILSTIWNIYADAIYICIVLQYVHTLMLVNNTAACMYAVIPWYPMWLKLNHLAIRPQEKLNSIRILISLPLVVLTLDSFDGSENPTVW